MSKRILMRELKRSSFSKHIELNRVPILCLILIFMTAPLLSIQPTVLAVPANLSITSSTQTFFAGTNNLVNFTITNIGYNVATEIFVSLSLPSSTTGAALMILNGSDGKYYINQLGLGQSYTISANIYVSPSAGGSAYQLIFTTNYNSEGSKTDTRTIGVNVPVYSPEAVIDMVLSKSDLRAGENNHLNITVKNIGTDPADSLSLYLAMPATGTALVLIGSDGSWSLGRLAPGEERIIPLEIFAAPSASGSIMSLTATTSYTDASLMHRQQTNYLGVIVKGITDVVVLDTSTFPVNVTPGKAFSLTVTVINLGTATAQSVIILPNGTADLQPVSTDKVFIGDLPIDVPSSFTISYIAGNISSGTYMLNLAFNYTDSLGQKLIGYLDVPLRLTIAANASTTNGQSDQSPFFAMLMFYLPIIAVIAVVIVAVYLYMRHRKSG